MIDAIIFKCHSSYYCYDIVGGHLLKINNIQSEVLTYYDIGSKNIVRKLRHKYSVKEIIENYSYIQQLLDNRFLQEKQHTDNGIIFDYSNLISLCKVYVQEKNEDTLNSFKLLQERYFMDDMQMCQEETSCENITDGKKDGIPELLCNIESFLARWEQKCRVHMDDDSLYPYTENIRSMQDSLDSIVNVMQQKEIMMQLPVLVRYMASIYRKEKKQFPCESGMKSLYIDKAGDVFICKDGLKIEELKQSYVSLLTSVYEEQPCCDCFARFLCGGYCKKNKCEMLACKCDAFKETMLLLLKCCVLLLEADEKYEQILLNWSDII